ncbi:MAG: excinuclease ABC subunit UvrB [Solirubrobacterales bacterium]
MNQFRLRSEYQPTGDQPQAIEQLVRGLHEGRRLQTLLGVTGSGKTYTMAQVIQAVQRPALILAHNKTLAGQLYSEFKEFFPENAVEFFISYYDYYQPEAYVPQSDTYIEKDSSTNDEIDKLRHSATAVLFERRDVIIVASVSCIYGLGSPEDYSGMVISLRPGMQLSRDQFMRALVERQYQRNETDFARGRFRARGDIVEVFPVQSGDSAIRVEFFGDEVERLVEFNPVTGEIHGRRSHEFIYPGSHYITTRERMLAAAGEIEAEMAEQVRRFKSAERLLEAQRIEQRTRYDLEMIREIGYCKGIENYSRYITGREPGASPYTLLDFFPDDFLMIVDESHVTLPQVRGMYEGDRARKEVLIDFGFRLPSALDNRPLKFPEFEERIKQMICTSATPGQYELQHSGQPAEQLIRPTGLVDPEIELLPTENQIDVLMEAIRQTVARGQRILVTTLTKRMAEDLTEYFDKAGIRVRYMHADVEALERLDILRDLRLGEFDVLIGINLLREGLDLPEVSLVAILDADKEGFLRSERSLIQTIGRAARNVDGRVMMFADRMTPSMRSAIDETNRRRGIQMAYNEAHGITPATIVKAIRDRVEATVAEDKAVYAPLFTDLPKDEKRRLVKELENDMKKASADLDFEKAARLRDMIKEVSGVPPKPQVKPGSAGSSKRGRGRPR